MHLTDTITLDGLRRTADGYLVADARVARTGIQIYSGREVDPENAYGMRDRETVRVYRPEAEVFARDAMATYAYRPVTIEHPREAVTADNWRSLAVGQTGGDVARDGEFVRVPLVLMDAAAIRAVEAGKRQLSMGYTTDLKFEDGQTPAGEQYDAVQTNFRMNHLAVVSAARGGPDLRLGDDEKDGHMTTATLKTMTVDGIAVEMTDTAVQVVNKALANNEKAIADSAKELTDAKAEVEKLKKDIEAKDAEIATLKKQAEDGKITPDKLDALVSDRATVIGKAKAMLGDKLVSDGKTDAEIRRQVVDAKLGEVAKDWSDEAVTASFNTLSADVKPTDPIAAAVSTQRSTDAAKTVADARAEMIRHITSPDQRDKSAA